MSKTDNTFFRILDIFAHFVLLNALWLIFCIPLITIFPATTALYAVVQRWVTEGIDAGSVGLFFVSFKKNFKKSFLIGLLWLVAGFILYFDLSILLQIKFTGSFFILVLLIFSIILYVFITVYVPFIIVQYEYPIFNILKNALILSVSRLHYTLLLMLIITAGLVITYYFKVFFIIFGSVLAFVLYHIFLKLDDSIGLKGRSE